MYLKCSAFQSRDIKNSLQYASEGTSEWDIEWRDTTNKSQFPCFIVFVAQTLLRIQWVQHVLSRLGSLMTQCMCAVEPTITRAPLSNGRPIRGQESNSQTCSHRYVFHLFQLSSWPTYVALNGNFSSFAFVYVCVLPRIRKIALSQRFSFPI